MGKRGELVKYKKSSSRVWREAKYRSEEARKVRCGRRKKLKKRRVTREVHGKNVV